MLYIVPSDFTNFDIENLQDVFQLKGKVIRGDNEVIVYIDKIAGCYGKRKRTTNIILQFDANKNVMKIQGF